MNWRKLLWWHDHDPQAQLEAQSRFEAVVADDARVNQLARRTAKILRENDLAPNIMRALGMRSR